MAAREAPVFLRDNSASMDSSVRGFLKIVRMLAEMNDAAAVQALEEWEEVVKGRNAKGKGS